MTRLLIVSIVATFLGGCLVSSRRPVHHHHHGKSEARGKRRDCPPSYHMSGGVCVANGRGRR
jgi:hypothetical protein